MTSTFWPMSYSAALCNLPEQLLKASRSFEQFYLSRHSGRRLTWQPSLGSVDVKVRFNTRTHDLNVSTFALTILLLFEDIEDGETLAYEVSIAELHSIFVTAKLVTVGYQNCHCYTRHRTTAQSAITGMCKVQSPEETSPWARCELDRFVLL